MKKWLFFLLLTSCLESERMERFESNASYRISALKLARENRILKADINDLRYQLLATERERNFLTMKLDQARTLAGSSEYRPVDVEDDLVKYATYKWDFNTLISLADKEFNSRDFKKSSQLYRTAFEIFSNLPMDENSYFKAGIASFESGYNDWAQEFFSDLISKFARSKYYRPSKLWLALTYQRQGKKDEYVKIKEEFRLNYQNSEEWKILASRDNPI
jgi:cell division protein FtsB